MKVFSCGNKFMIIKSERKSLQENKKQNNRVNNSKNIYITPQTSNNKYGKWKKINKEKRKIYANRSSRIIFEMPVKRNS